MGKMKSRRRRIASSLDIHSLGGEQMRYTKHRQGSLSLAKLIRVAEKIGLVFDRLDSWLRDHFSADLK